MKVLITGGAGFIGSHITDAIAAEGYETVVVDNLTTGRKAFLPSGIMFYEQNICEPGLQAVFHKEKPDIVIHQAAQGAVVKSMEQPVFDADVNAMGTIRLLELSARYGVRKFIFASTAALYGTPKRLPVQETHPANPVSFYGLSKWTAERYIRLYAHIGLSYCILRYANVYGMRQNAEGEAGVICMFMNHLLEGKPLHIFGDGEQTRDFVFVKDVVQANLAAMRSKHNGVFNISSGTQLSLNQLIMLLEKTAGVKAEVQYQSERQGDIRHSYLHNQKALRLLKWQCQHSIMEGLAETFAYYKTQKEEMSKRKSESSAGFRMNH